MKILDLNQKELREVNGGALPYIPPMHGKNAYEGAKIAAKAFLGFLAGLGDGIREGLE